MKINKFVSAIIVDESISSFWSKDSKKNEYIMAGWPFFHIFATKRLALNLPFSNSALLGWRDIKNMIWVTEPESYLVDGVIFPQAQKLTWFKDS